MLQCWGEGTVILNRVTSIRHIEKVKFLQRLEGNRVNDNNEKHFKINSQCKGPKFRVYGTCLRNSKETSVTEVQQSSGTVVTEKAREVKGWSAHVWPYGLL